MAGAEEPLVPLYGFLQGDTLGLLVLARQSDRLGDLAAQLQRSAGVRVRPAARVAVVRDGVLLDSAMTVGQAGLAPLDRFDVIRQEEPGA